ncbi:MULTISPECIES: hypothetical protein [Aerosakkonema]|uniref:hypothetical protein n=1 Tax=Aerosakkonema TaxID=1246629 RepID=UPI0035B77063
MSPTSSELSFKFRFVENGNAQGLFSQKAIATDREIILGTTTTLFYEQITDTLVRDKRLVIVWDSPLSGEIEASSNSVNNYVYVLEVYNVNPQNLKKHIDQVSSRKRTENNKSFLRESGQYHLFRSATCPECQATIDLSDHQRTSYIYCRFCQSIFKENQPAITKGEKYCVCDECQMFNRVQSYTEFYFYFLVFVYGFYAKSRYVCDNCANSIFWKTFWLNLIFLIGVPTSVWVKIKSSIGRDRYLKQLPKANAISLKGKYQKAEHFYNQMYQQYPEHPGLLMNEGLGHLIGNNVTTGMRCFERSLRSCANYYPVITLLHRLQESDRER